MGLHGPLIAMNITIKTNQGQVLTSTQSTALGIEHAAASAIRQSFDCASHLVPTGQDDNGMQADNGMFFDIVKTKDGLTLLQDH